MKKIFLLFLVILNLFCCFSQSKTQVLEDYILKNNDLKKVSRLKISYKVLQREIQTYLDMGRGDSLNHTEVYNLIVNEFDYKNLNEVKINSHKFSFKVGKQKFEKIRYSQPIFSKDGKYAIFYQAMRNRKGLCGTSSLILMENNNGTWEEKEALIVWIS